MKYYSSFILYVNQYKSDQFITNILGKKGSSPNFASNINRI